MSRYNSHTDNEPGQIVLGFGQRDQLDAMIDSRAAVQAKAEATYWRLRLMTIESVMMAALVLGAGLAMKQGAALALRNAAIVGLGCLAVGVLTVGLAALTSRGLSRLAMRMRAYRARRG